MYEIILSILDLRMLLVLMLGKIKELAVIVTFQTDPSSKKYQEEVLQQRLKWVLISRGLLMIRHYLTQSILILSTVATCKQHIVDVYNGCSL